MGKVVGKLFFKKGTDKFSSIPSSFWQLSCPSIDGIPVDFSGYQNNHKAFLVVNVASFWGLTNKNYTELVQLDNELGEKGLKILGFPCNQFKEQEPKTNEEIK